MGLRRTTQPAGEPVSLEEAKLHLRVDTTDEDDLITGLIGTARMDAEKRMRRTLMQSGWTFTLDGFAGLYELPMAPLIAVGSIAYVDTDGASQVLSPAAYKVDATGEPGRVIPVGGWPATAVQPAAVTVVFTAGYATAADVPRPIRNWMLLMIGEMYKDRETSPDVPTGLLDPYKVWG
ncbi:head-tail connector protein [Cupriavidus sp. 2MCAB6]|uniref:head-tail connector protein n=1 Tax=Cupriavidus sp. 2MCAB6 TaxID=3232981 RepID=UPI003F8EE45E